MHWKCDHRSIRNIDLADRQLLKYIFLWILGKDHSQLHSCDQKLCNEYDQKLIQKSCCRVYANQREKISIELADLEVYWLCDLIHDGRTHHGRFLHLLWRRHYSTAEVPRLGRGD